MGALLRKELLVELRTLESVPGMSLFALTTFVVFHFALNRNSVSGDEAAGILWVTLLFAAILGVNRLFVNRLFIEWEGRICRDIQHPRSCFAPLG